MKFKEKVLPLYYNLMNPTGECIQVQPRLVQHWDRGENYEYHYLTVLRFCSIRSEQCWLRCTCSTMGTIVYQYVYSK